MKNLLKIIVIILASNLNLFAQTDGIIESSAYHSSNMSYNTGEVYVIFNEVENNSRNSHLKNSDEIEINTGADIFAYPNPVIDKLNIISSTGIGVKKISIYSLDGKLVSIQNVINNQINLSELPQSTYILKTDIPNSKIFKILKQ